MHVLRGCWVPHTVLRIQRHNIISAPEAYTDLVTYTLYNRTTKIMFNIYSLCDGLFDYTQGRVITQSNLHNNLCTKRHPTDNM